MDILMLTDRLLLGGAETHIYTLARSLTRMGHRVVLVSSGGEIARRLGECGVRHITLPLDSRRPSDISRCLICLSALLRRRRFDLLHAHARLPAYIAHLLSRRYSLPLVVSAHARFSHTSLRRRLSRWGFPTIAISEDLKQYLCDIYSLPPENIRVIPNGFDTDNFYPAPSPPPRPLKIVTVSRLDRDCSLAALTLCSVAPRLSAELGHIEILIVGGGDMFPTLRRLAREVNSALGYPCVRLLGAVEDVAPLLRSCHIFVGVSRAALEAVLCGLPTVICGNEGYLGELTQDGLALAASANFCARGLPRVSPDALRASLISLCKRDPSELRAAALALRDKVADGLDAATMAERTLSVYKEALSLAPRHGGSVLLCGYYGFSNMGDNALLRSAAEHIRSVLPSAPIRALTRGGRRDSADFGLPCVCRHSPLAVPIELMRCKYFVLGGGTLLQDSTSLRSLLYYWSLTRLARTCGAHCYMLGGGIASPRSPLGAALIRDTLRLCDGVGLRDSESVGIAKRLAPSARVYRQADLALSVFPASNDRADFILSRLFGSVTPPPFVLAAPRKGDGLCELVRALKIYKRRGLSLCLVPMHKGQDTALAHRLSERLGGVMAENICYSDLLALAARSNGVLTMRLHALLAARSAGVPCYAFGSDKRLRRGYFARA